MIEETNNWSDNVLDMALSSNSRMAYAKGWSYFEEYCNELGVDALDASPEIVVDFLITAAARINHRTGSLLSFGTIALYKNAINRKYVDQGEVSPTQHSKVSAVLKGLMRLRGTAPRQVKALSGYHIQKMLAICDVNAKHPPVHLISLRNAAVLAIGFAGALRRSELCQLVFEDVEMLQSIEQPDVGKMFLHIRKSKTDQQGRGQRIAILEGRYIRPISRLRVWLEASNIQDGPLFQTMRRGGGLRGSALHHSDIPRLVKHYAGLIGLDPREVSGHSLRAGFVTSAATHHARLDKIMAITRHKNPSTVLRYIRDADSFRDHAGADFL